MFHFSFYKHDGKVRYGFLPYSNTITTHTLVLVHFLNSRFFLFGVATVWFPVYRKLASEGEAKPEIRGFTFKIKLSIYKTANLLTLTFNIKAAK